MNLILSINKKTALILIIFSFGLQNSIAQEAKNDFWEHVRFGGGLGLNFGDGFFSATIAPSGIYQFDKNLGPNSFFMQYFVLGILLLLFYYKFSNNSVFVIYLLHYHGSMHTLKRFEQYCLRSAQSAWLS